MKPSELVMQAIELFAVTSNWQVKNSTLISMKIPKDFQNFVEATSKSLKLDQAALESNFFNYLVLLGISSLALKYKKDPKMVRETLDEVAKLIKE